MKYKWGDFVVILLVIIFAGMIYYVMLSPQNTDAKSLVAVVKSEGKEINRIRLTDLPEEVGKAIHFDGTYTLTIEAKHDKIRVAHANCPDQVCVHTGWINKPGQTVVCLPNRLSITILGEGDVDEVVK